MYSSNAPLSSWFRILMMLLFLCRSIWFAPVCSVLLCAGPCFKSLHSEKSIWREINSLKASKLPVHRAQGMHWDVACIGMWHAEPKGFAGSWHCEDIRTC